MHRFFAKQIINNICLLNDSDISQIKNVLKLKQDENIVCVFNNNHYLGQINYQSKNEINVINLKKLDQNHESPVRITLIAGLIRNVKWDYLLQKSTELGVTNIVPFQFRRCVVQLSGEKNDNKLTRWIKICKEASEQSYRNQVPQIAPISSDLNSLSQYLQDVNLLCYENEENSKLLKERLQQNFNGITIVIGPEGGFDENEIMVLTNMGYESVSLGKRILRAETAPIAVLSALMYEKEL